MALRLDVAAGGQIAAPLVMREPQCLSACVDMSLALECLCGLRGQCVFHCHSCTFADWLRVVCPRACEACFELCFRVGVVVVVVVVRVFKELAADSWGCHGRQHCSW